MVNFQTGENIKHFKIYKKMKPDYLPIALELRLQREEPSETRNA